MLYYKDVQRKQEKERMEIMKANYKAGYYPMDHAYYLVKVIGRNEFVVKKVNSGWIKSHETWFNHKIKKF